MAMLWVADASWRWLVTLSMQQNPHFFGQPEVKLGVVPGFGGTQRLPRRIGAAKAKEWLATGDVFPSSEALALGLVNRLFETKDEMMEFIAVLAEKVNANGPRAVATTKELVGKGSAMSVVQSIAMENQYFADCFETQEQKEGMEAFLNKRKPNFASTT